MNDDILNFDKVELLRDELIEVCNEINQAIGEAIIEDGRVYIGTTNYQNKVALRPAIVNWRTREEDIEFIADIVQELGGRIA